jgi:hypothetical protein
MSNLKDQSSFQKCMEKNLKNWAMIAKQCEKIGSSNSKDLNNLLLEALMTLGTFDLQIASLDLNRLPS